MKRNICKIIAIILCLATVLSLFGCVSTEVEKKDKSTKKDTEDEEILDEDAEGESETESETESEEITSDTESETETETETGTESNTVTETESESKKETETETAPVVKEDPIPGKTKTTEDLKAKSYNLAVKSSTFR